MIVDDAGSITALGGHSLYLWLSLKQRQLNPSAFQRPKCFLFTSILGVGGGCDLDLAAPQTDGCPKIEPWAWPPPAAKELGEDDNSGLRLFSSGIETD